MVNEAYDEGQIVLQRVVPVPAGCTSAELAAKVLQCEHEWFWQVVAAFATGDIISTATKNPAMAVDASRFLDKINPVHKANNPGSLNPPTCVKVLMAYRLWWSIAFIWTHSPVTYFASSTSPAIRLRCSAGTRRGFVCTLNAWSAGDSTWAITSMANL